MPNLEGAGPETPITTNAHGGKQSDIPYRFDLMDGPALAEMAKVLKYGAEKYENNTPLGQENWRKISVQDHLNHVMLHTLAWLSGDRQDDHLSHIMCRAMFAQGVDLSDPHL